MAAWRDQDAPVRRYRASGDGFLLRRLQHGELLSLPISRPMPSIGKGCHELRVVDSTKTWRLICRLDPDAVVILEIFAKNTVRTPQRIIDVRQERLRRYDDA